MSEDAVGIESFEEEEVLEEEEIKEVAGDSVIAWFANTFALEDNILDSGDQPISIEDGTAVMGNDKVQVVVEGVGISKLITMCLSLRMGSFLLATLVGVCIGLVVSAWVRTATQAVMWVPLVLIPQILLGGFVITVPDMSDSVLKFSRFFPSFSAQRLVDISHLYGRSTPSLSNRTKVPLFLTSNGEKESIVWESTRGELSQEYEQISDVNTSWQNLAVRGELLGEHKQYYNVAYGTDIQIFTDTVDERRDVYYMQGTVVKNMWPAYSALTVLFCWIAGCYMLILIGLWQKK